MSRYSKIDRRVWSDKKFRKLSPPPPSGRYLWMYLLTSPHLASIPGLLAAGEAMLAEALEWSVEGFRQAFGEASGQGMVKADWKARLVFVGEGPGAEEDNQGIPFVGAAGQLLTKMIAAMGYTRDEVYICNVVKCRPPGNRNPEPDEIQACQPFLEAQLKAIRPSVIIALGKFAAQTLLRTDTPITRLRGQWREYVGIPLMPTFHPAYLLRNAPEKKSAWADLQAVMGRFPKPTA